MSAIDWATSLSIKLYERKLAPNKTKQLSNEFTYLIQCYLTKTQLKQLRKLNHKHRYCSTHDFCDSNELMLIATDNLQIEIPDEEIARGNFFSGFLTEAWGESRDCNFRLSFLPRVYYSLWNFSKWGSFTTDPEIEVI
jgi:hypothetical protein